MSAPTTRPPESTPQPNGAGGAVNGHSKIVAPQQMTGAQAVVRSLEELDVDTIFGIPGGAVLPVYDPLFVSKKVRHVLVRHEQGAGHAAEGYASASGKVGVAIATSGPGATTPYDWEGMMVALIHRIHERGLPATQAELVAEMQDWFADQTDGQKIPDSRSIRRRVTPVWKKLRGEGS